MHFIFRKFILICFLWRSWHSPDFWWNVDPLKPKTFPLLNPASKCPGVSWGQFVQPLSIPRFTCIICAKFIPNWSSRLTTFPLRLLNCLPPKPPPPNDTRGVSCGELFFAYVHSQMNRQTCTELGANRSIRLAAFPDLNLWPPKPPPQMPPGLWWG